MASFNAPMDDKVPKGATKVTIRPAQGPALGQFEMVGKPPAGAQVAPQPAQQMPAQISEPHGMPKGAQPVPLVQSGPQLSAPQPVAGPAIPQRSPFMAAPQAAVPQMRPQPQAQPQQPRRFSTDVHTIEVVAQGPDGQEYSAAYEVEVPAGSKLLGVRSYLNQQS